MRPCRNNATVETKQGWLCKYHARKLGLAAERPSSGTAEKPKGTMKEINCIKCGQPAAFPKVVKEPYTCLTCQTPEQPATKPLTTARTS
jgi:hypothetical protein